MRFSKRPQCSRHSFIRKFEDEQAKCLASQQEILVLLGCGDCGKRLVENNKFREDTRILYRGDDKIGVAVCGECFRKITNDSYRD